MSIFLHDGDMYTYSDFGPTVGGVSKPTGRQEKAELHGVALWHDMTTTEADAWGYIVECKAVEGVESTIYRHRKKSGPIDEWTPGLPPKIQQEADKLMAAIVGNLAEIGIVEAE